VTALIAQTWRGSSRFHLSLAWLLQLDDHVERLSSRGGRQERLPIALSEIEQVQINHDLRHQVSTIEAAVSEIG
jgi:anti-sigma regulatory factor (Ser/Thr protein kinase)